MIISKKYKVMKKSIILLIICVCACCISSCLSNKKITIKGTPGTEIYLPYDGYRTTYNGERKLLTVIGDNGETKIKFGGYKYRAYFPYLLTFNAETNKYYPVALDYKYNVHNKEDGMLLLLSIPTVGYYAAFNVNYIESAQYRHSFDYTEELTINPNRPNAPYANTGERRKVKSGKAALLKQQSASTSSKLLSKDFGRELAGSYKGSGKLLQGESIVENYSSMTIRMTYIDRNSVAVDVLMGDDEEVLSAVDYKIKRLGDGHFLLTSEKDEAATIEVNGSNVLYNNPNVNIDGETYILQISVR